MTQAASLPIVSEFKNNASRGVNKLTGDLKKQEKQVGRMSKAFGNFQKFGKAAFLGVGAAVAIGGVALAKFGLDAVGVARDFESQMAILSTAASNTGVSMETLSDAALAVGADTSLIGVSAAGAADAMTGLFKAGLSAGEVFGDLNGFMAGTAELGGALRASIDLAAASELDMVQASGLAAVALATFGGEAETAAERSQFINEALNNFVQAADASQADVSQLADAMKNVGPAAASFGFSIEEVNTALAILSDRGIVGAEAGTQLKSMMLNILRPTAKVKSTLSDLNVELFDAGGNLKKLPEILGSLEKGLAGATQETRLLAIQTLAGSFGQNAMNALLQEGTIGWQEMTAAIGEAATMQEVAAARTDTLDGAMEALGGVWESLQIMAVDKLLPVLQRLTDWAAVFVENAAPPLIGAFENFATFVFNVLDAVERLTAGLARGEDAYARITIFIGEIGIAAGFAKDEVFKFTKKLRDNKDEILKSIEPYVAFAEKHLTLKNVMIGLGIAILSFVIPAIGSLIVATGGVAIILVAVVAAAQLLHRAWVENWGGIQEKTAEVLAWLEQNISAALDAIQGFWEQHGRGITTFLAGLWGLIVENVRGFLDNLRLIWEGFWALLTGDVATAGEKIGLAIVGIIENWAKLFAGLWNLVVPHLTAFFSAVWAWASDANNWKSVGDTIVTNVVSGLAAFASAVGPKLAEWLGVFQTWIATNGPGFIERGKEIVANIIEGLGQFVTDVGAKLEEWDQAFRDWVGIPETWEEFGELIAKGILGGLFIVDEINKKLQEWGLIFGTWIEENYATWLENGKQIVRNILDGVKEGPGDLGAWLGALWDKMKAAIMDLNWSSIGQDIINGIVSGVQGFASGAMDAIEGVGRGMKNVFDEEIDRGSPAKEFVKAGQDILRGLREGVTDSVILNDLFGDVKFVADGVIGTMLDSLAGFIDGIAAAFEGIGDTTSIEDLSGFTGLIKDVTELIGPALEALTQISLFDTSGTGGITAAVNSITFQLRELMKAFGRNANAMLIEIKEGAGEFALVTREVADAVMGGIEALQAIAPISGSVVEGGLTDKIKGITKNISELITAFGEAAKKIGGPLMVVAVEFASAASAAAGALKDAVGSLVALGDLDAEMSPVANMFNLSVVRIFITSLIKQFGAAAEDLGGLLMENAKRFAAAATAVLAPIGAGVDAVNKLADWEVDMTAIGKVSALRNFILDLVRMFGEAAGFLTDDLKTAADQFATAAASVLKPITDGVEAINAMATIEVFPTSDSLFQLGIVLQSLVTQFGIAFNLTDDLLENAAAFAETAGVVVQPVADGVAAIKSLVELEELETLPTFAAFETLVNALKLLAERLGEAADAAFLEVLPAAQEFGAAIGDIVGGIGPAVQAIKDFGTLTREEFELASNAAAEFGIQFLEFIVGLAKGLHDATFEAEEAIAAAAAVSEKLTKVLSVIAPGLAAIKAISESEPPQHLIAKIETFAAHLLFVILFMKEKLNNIEEFAGEGVTAAAAFSDSVAKLLANLGSAVEGLGKIGATKVTGVQKNLAKLEELFAKILESSDRMAGDSEKTIPKASAIAAGVMQIVESFALAISQLEMLGATDAPKSIQAILGAIEGIFKSKTGPAHRASFLYGTAIARGFKQAAGYNVMFEIGRQSILGLIAGINSQRSALVAAMRSAAMAAAASARAALGIASDSTVFMEIGENAVSGFLRPFENLSFPTAPLTPTLAGAGAGTPAGATVSNQINVEVIVQGDGDPTAIAAAVEQAVNVAVEKLGVESYVLGPA